jgi:hypothetical protein
MADLNVQPKTGGNYWLWIVIAVVVIAIIAWYLLSH